MLSNLPPGVTDAMIPGNRPEDVASEEWETALMQRLDERGIDVDNPLDLMRLAWEAFEWGREHEAADAKGEAQIDRALAMQEQDEWLRDQEDHPF